MAPAGTLRAYPLTKPEKEPNAMASIPTPNPDTVEPAAPPIETPPPINDPIEPASPPETEPPAPDIDQPGRGPDEVPPE